MSAQNPLAPSASLLAKLSSVVVHASFSLLMVMPSIRPGGTCPLMFAKYLPVPKWASQRGFSPDGVVITMKGCPDCKGRGYFCDNIFASNTSTDNFHQCLTCLKAADEAGQLQHLRDNPSR